MSQPVESILMPEPITFNYSKLSIKKQKMVNKKYLCVDLDETLVSAAHMVKQEFKNYRHLQNISIRISGQYREYFAINYRAMAKIFAAILDPEIPEDERTQIVFITKARYTREILEVLESLYGLPKESLTKCIYLNRDSKGNDKKVLKGDVIVKSQIDGLIPADANVILLDDNPEHIRNAAEHNFDTIKADGCPLKGEVDNIYLLELIDKLSLNVRINPSDPAYVRMKGFRCG